LLGTRLSDVTPLLIENWCPKRIKAGVTGSPCNRETATLKAALNKVVEWGFLPANPFAKFKRFKVDYGKRFGYMGEDEDAYSQTASLTREDHVWS
jgi:hypothetical protein